MSCTTLTGLNRSNSLATVTLPVVGNTGTVSTKATTAGSGSTASTTSTATVQGVNLLDGAVVAEAVTTTATARDEAGTQSSSGETTFAGLTVAGRSFAANVPVNTRIPLVVGGTRVGTVTLNQQVKSTLNGVHAISIRGISISLLAGNPFGVPGSTSVFVGGVNASVTTPRIGRSGGSGWGVSATALDGTAAIGRQPHIGVPCFGGSRTGSLATITREPLVTTGTTSVLAVGSGSATTATSRVVTSIAKPSILGGLISADSLVSEAHAVRTSSGTIATGDRSKFVGLSIAGLPSITDSVAPNTVIDVPGLGTVTLHKVVKTSRGIEIVMIEIKLSESIAGLPTGSVVQLAGANATVIT